MTRGKPTLFSRETHDAARAQRKQAAESAFHSRVRLPKSPPAQLDGLPAAQAAWRALLKVHSDLPADLLSGLDRDFLIGYCLAVQMRTNALELERIVTERYRAGQAELSDLRELVSAVIDRCQAGKEELSELLKLENLVTDRRQAAQAEYSELIKARAELRQTVRLVSDLEKQIYATPKSRAGVVPLAREESPQEVVEREMRDLDRLLEEGDDG